MRKIITALSFTLLSMTAQAAELAYTNLQVHTVNRGPAGQVAITFTNPSNRTVQAAPEVAIYRNTELLEVRTLRVGALTARSTTHVFERIPRGANRVVVVKGAHAL